MPRKDTSSLTHHLIESAHRYTITAAVISRLRISCLYICIEKAVRRFILLFSIPNIRMFPFVSDRVALLEHLNYIVFL